jgi:hypothetical protein
MGRVASCRPEMKYEIQGPGFFFYKKIRFNFSIKLWGHFGQKKKVRMVELQQFRSLGELSVMF